LTKLLPKVWWLPFFGTQCMLHIRTLNMTWFYNNNDYPVHLFISLQATLYSTNTSHSLQGFWIKHTTHLMYTIMFSVSINLSMCKSNNFKQISLYVQLCCITTKCVKSSYSYVMTIKLELTMIQYSRYYTWLHSTVT